MYKKAILLLISALFISGIVFAQPGRFHPSGEHKKIIMQFRNLELLKALNLTDEESEIALPIIKDIDLLMENSYDTHIKVMNNLKAALDDNDNKEITKNIDLLLTQEEELNKKRTVLYKELRKALGEEKFARYLIFMQSFGRDLQDKIKMMREDDQFPEKPLEDPNRE